MPQIMNDGANFCSCLAKIIEGRKKPNMLSAKSSCNLAITASQK